jgi:uridine phosphorylase
MDDFSPLLEFDPGPGAILEPHAPHLEGGPAPLVFCFFREVLNRLVRKQQLRKVGRLASEIGPNPVYELLDGGPRLLVTHPGVGAPLAASFLEELISAGVTRFIACGGCGVIDRDIAAGHVIILTAAVRDEGTSYHYLPASREVAAAPAAVTALEDTLRRREIPYRLGKTWTTDGLYRETIERRVRRRKDGCSVVEMEAAAFFAVAQVRRVTFGQVVYGGDLVVPEGWDKRAWHERVNDRELLFWLAVEAARALS